MATVNYCLKKTEASGKALIFLRYFVNGRALTYSFGQTTEPKNWNKEKQRVKNNKITSEDGLHSRNDLLDTLAKVLTTAYNNELNPNPEIIR